MRQTCLTPSLSYGSVWCDTIEVLSWTLSSETTPHNGEFDTTE